MSPIGFLLTSLWHYRRVHLAVLAGVVVATTVITGALLVGDSVRGSLRGLALARLGDIETVLTAEQPFRAELAAQLAPHANVAPLLLVPGSLRTVHQQRSRHATGLSIVGCEPQFWKFGVGPSPAPLTVNQIALTGPLAVELGAEIGSEVLLRVNRPSRLPADSTLGEKSETISSQRLRVATILPARGLANFSLRPNQQPPRNAFVSLATLQDLLELPARANALALGPAEPHVLEEALQPTLDDFNILVEQADAQIASVTAQRLVLPPAIVNDVRRQLPQTEVQAVITYLANTISLGARQIPYSTICGVDSVPQLGPLLDESGAPIVLADDQCVLNDWAAQDLDAQVGDQVRIRFYEPETTHGDLQEAPPVLLSVRAVVPLLDAQGQKTAAHDPRLTPRLPGVTDQTSIGNWRLPFELVETIRTIDEQYWDAYSTTPKVFVSYALAKRLWNTRWGTDSVLRIPVAAGLTTADIQQRVRPTPGENGLRLVRAKAQGLTAANGTTAFEGLFLGFSFFLIASSIMLIALLFRLGAEGRCAEAGLLSAIGMKSGQLRGLWLSEAAAVAIAGALVGSAAGIGYARLMIHGLTTWWLAATVTPFLELHWSATSLALGFVGGVLATLLTIAWSLRKLLQISPGHLLAGNCVPQQAAGTASATQRWLPWAMLGAAIGLAVLAQSLPVDSQAGAFFGSGSFVMLSLLTWLSRTLRESKTSGLKILSLAGLATRNAGRYPSRTILSVALTAVASFLIVALSAFRLAPTRQGTGGFDLIGTADQPIHFDLDTAAGRAELGFGQQAENALTSATVHAFRIRAGEDASCLNLYQPSEPQLIGVPRNFYGENQFSWAARSNGPIDQPWQLLDGNLGQDDQGRDIVPIALDKNTSAYSLHLGGIGAQMKIRDAQDRPVTLQVAGLLSGSIWQGHVLMNEARLLKLFPDTAGNQMFLIRAPAGGPAGDDLAEILETQLEDHGFDATIASERLAAFQAVQNTYLSTFQSLGALGLLLGTVGLAVAQLRSVVERRSELALLGSAGLRRSRIAKLVLYENGIVLLTGLGIGCAAALTAVVPHWCLQEATTPWQTLVALLACVAAAGLAAGTLAVRSALRAPLLPALRGD
ncbi:MAG: ABC transporter permease [Pirellulales bacterium]|nr:ABC transporter permease [Pirellulales bacterium]